MTIPFSLRVLFFFFPHADLTSAAQGRVSYSLVKVPELKSFFPIP